MKLLAGYGTGLIFGLGLLLGGMTDPARILGFLDLAGHWDSTLAFVMLGAVAVTALGYRWLFRSAKPWLEASFHLPAAAAIDRRLVIGAVLFGVGWGLAGYCPGPAIVSVWSGSEGVYLLLAGMILGCWLARRAARKPLFAAKATGHAAS